MLDLSHLPPLPLDLLLSSAPPPPPAGPVRLSLADHPERERPTLLRECLARMGLRYEINPMRDMQLEVDLGLNLLSDVQIASGNMHGSCNRRTRALVEDDTDDAALLINFRGPHLIEQRNKEITLGDGEAVLVSSADPSAFSHRAPGGLLALRFPKRRLAPLMRGGEHCYMRHISSDNAALRLLTNYVALTWSEQMTASPELRHLMAAHICDLVAVTIGAPGAREAAQGGGVPAARLHAIKQDILATLDQPNLSVTALADRHHCNERYLQRLFEAEGTTFTAYVQEQRLSRAYRLLLDPRRAGEKISAVAYDCGFGDVSYFNRVFRRRYGAAPSDVRARAERAD